MKKKILVIDDSSTVPKMIGRLLKPLNVEILHAINGIDGVRKALRYHPHLITVDVEMPTLNGFETMKILDLLQLPIPAVFVTARLDISEHAKEFPTVVNFCEKVALKEKLLGIVEDVFEDSKARDYHDLTYQLDQKELQNLLGISNRKKILVVEDSKPARNILLKHLEETGLYELYEASDGQEAVFKAGIIQPDLILSDILMPNVDGLLMAKMLYIMGHPFPIIFISTRNDIETVKKAKSLEGVRGYILKQEIIHDAAFLQKKVAGTLLLSDKEKNRLQNYYQSISTEKLESLELDP